MTRSLSLFAALIATFALAGCSGESSQEELDGPEEAEGALETGSGVETITFDSDRWRAKIGEKQFEFCSLQYADQYKIANTETLLLCRDGERELIVDTDGNVGRLKSLEDGKSKAIACTQSPLPNSDYKRAFKCTTTRATVNAKFASFDKRETKESVWADWLPSTPPSAQKGLIDKALERAGGIKFKGVMSRVSSKCEVELEKGDGTLTATVYQITDTGERRKLMAFDGPEKAIRGVAQGEKFYALQSQIASGDQNFSGVRDRKLVISEEDDGKRIEIIASDNGGSSSKYCRRLQ